MDQNIVKKKKWKCPHCDKCVVNKKDHLRTHSGAKPFACDVEGCDFRAKWMHTVVMHKKQFHSDVRPFACNECDYRSKRKDRLEYHVLGVHRNEKRFACRFCDYKSAALQNMNKHEATHSDERPFECRFPDCDFRTKTNDGLRKHHQLVHLKTKRHVCHVCNKRFSNSTNLKQHIRKHIKEGHDLQSCGECMPLKSVDKNRSEAIRAGFKRKNLSGQKESVEPNVLNNILPETHLVMQLVADFF